jgi:hypothetical protein
MAASDPTNRTYISFDPSRGWPAGSTVYYECLHCGEVIPSLPPDSIDCACGNIGIDVDYGRLSSDEKIPGNPPFTVPPCHRFTTRPPGPCHLMPLAA